MTGTPFPAKFFFNIIRSESRYSARDVAGLIGPCGGRYAGTVLGKRSVVLLKPVQNLHCTQLAVLTVRHLQQREGH
jgi:hypothetical protein